MGTPKVSSRFLLCGYHNCVTVTITHYCPVTQTFHCFHVFHILFVYLRNIHFSKSVLYAYYPQVNVMNAMSLYILHLLIILC